MLKPTQFAPHFRAMLDRNPWLENKVRQSQPGDARTVLAAPRAVDGENATLFIVRIRKREPRTYINVQAKSAKYPNGWLYPRTNYVVTGTQYNVCKWDWASDGIDVLHITRDSQAAHRALNRLARGLTGC